MAVLRIHDTVSSSEVKNTRVIVFHDSTEVLYWHIYTLLEY